jgi:hypothetical protein
MYRCTAKAHTNCCGVPQKPTSGRKPGGRSSTGRSRFARQRAALRAVVRCSGAGGTVLKAAGQYRAHRTIKITNRRAMPTKAAHGGVLAETYYSPDDVHGEIIRLTI